MGKCCWIAGGLAAVAVGLAGAVWAAEVGVSGGTGSEGKNAATSGPARVGAVGGGGGNAFAGRACDSYSGASWPDGRPLLWGQAPLTDFGSREVAFDTTGVRELKPSPAAGVHPRIFFGPDELAEVRARVRETRCGQEAWKNILCWTEMMKGQYDEKAAYAQPDRWNGGFGGLRGRVPLFRLGVPREKGFAYNRHPAAAKIYNSLADGTATSFPEYYWNTMALEAFRCLIDEDTAGAKKLSAAVVTAMKIDQAAREAKRAELAKKNPKKAALPPDQPVGGFQLAFCYDFLFNAMTPEQRKKVHAELAATTWSHDNYGTFNTAESSRSNWATFSYWLFQVLAIEGEEGFNELKVRGMYRGWRNLLTYGWFESGATYEGEAKNQLGMDGIILFTKRAGQYGFENLSGHPYLQAYARSFLPHSANAMLTGFHKYDLLGGSRAGSGGFASTDSVGLKYMFPNDRTIDWYYRQAIGEDYSGVPDRPDGYFNALLFFAIYASDFDPTNTDPKKLGLGNTFFCGERSLLMTRSSWDASATQLNLHTRQANGGHPFADRNAIMVAGAGRVWSPNQYASFRTQENSVVGIDDQSQQETVPGRMVDYVDTPAATFAVGDAKYAWDWQWKRLDKKPGPNGGSYYTAADIKAGTVQVPAGWEPEKHTTNDFSYLKLGHAYLGRPLFESGHWIAPKGSLSPMVRQALFPVKRAFRTAGLVRGERPYVLVVDDIQKDETVHRYDWTLTVEYDVQIAKVERTSDREMDIYLTGSDPDQRAQRPKEPLPGRWSGEIEPGQPMLLVRVLNCSAAEGGLEPEIVEKPNMTDAKKYGPVRRLVISARAVSPEFKVMLVPFREGESLPATSWNAERTVLTVKAGGAIDEFSFTPGPLGRSNVAMTRDGKAVLKLDRAVEALK